MRSAIPNITTVLDNDVDVVIFTGDADCVCSWPGTLNVADALPLAHRAEFRDRKLERYDVDGVQKGAYKTVKNLSFIKVAGAGHNVPFYSESPPSQRWLARVLTFRRTRCGRPDREADAVGKGYIDMSLALQRRGRYAHHEMSSIMW